MLQTPDLRLMRNTEGKWSAAIEWRPIRASDSGAPVAAALLIAWLWTWM